jgi:hypothetical protein
MGLAFEFMLLGAGLLVLVLGARWLIKRMPDNRPYKFALILAIAATFLTFWVNGAVGIIGSENNDANAMYLAIILIALVGSMVVQFRPAGMAWVAGMNAIGMIVIAVLALVFDLGVTGPVWPMDVVGVTVFFVCFWAGAAWLFHAAAERQERVAS